MRIVTTDHGFTVYAKSRWTAINSDEYDGAPDSKPPLNCIGFGDTEMEAVEDLFENIRWRLES